jgi:hypothetical protein
MLPANEIEQKFSHLQQTIGEAEKAAKTEDNTPPELLVSIEMLARESKKANEVIRSNDEARIIACIDDLESISDEAKRVSRSDPKTPAHLETVVTQVHAELSKLKHQLH